MSAHADGRAPAPRRLVLLPLVLLLLLPLAPGALALDAQLLLQSGEPVVISGHVRAEAPGAILHAEDDAGRGLATFSGATGTLALWTYRAAAVGGGRGEKVPAEDAREQRFPLDNATFTITLRGERFSFTADARDDGLVHAGGDARLLRGRPVLLDQAHVRQEVHPLVFKAPPTVPWTWDAGWLYVGTPMGAQAEGFPRWGNATLGVLGGVYLAAEGGTLDLTRGNETLTFRLGEHAGPAGLAGAPGVQLFTRMTFEGVLSDASIPAPSLWGIAAPAMTWTVEGHAAWTRATGTLRSDGREVAFEDAPVDAAGTFRLAPAASPVADAVAPASYEGGGRFDSLRVGRAPALAPPPGRVEAAPAAAAATFGLLALLLALTETGRDLLARACAALYTRIVREDLLQHPLRRRLHEIVHAEPGIHLREAQRRLGTTWGPLAFHLRMLVQAGHLRLEKRGGYTHVWPQGAPADAAPLPHPLARRIHDTLPEDGTPMPARQLRSRVGLSRQLLAYHLKALQRRELVTFVDPGPEGERLVARVKPQSPRQG